MGKTFQNIHACSIGNFEGNGDKIPQWIRANGGNYSRDVNRDVTHLITTREAYRKNVDAVKKAKKLGTIKIVSYDWLEDSLLSKSRKPKKVGQYLLERILKSEAKKEKSKEKAKRGKNGKKVCPKKGMGGRRAGIRKGGRADKDGMEVLDYHLYTDKSTKTTYSATLVRPLMLGKSKEKYQVKIYESNNTPHTYATYTKYTRIGKSSSSLLAEPGSTIDSAIAAFKEFFKAQTSKEWEERLDGKLPPLKRDSEGNVLPVHEGWFQHEVPMGLLASFLRQEPTTSATADLSGGEGVVGQEVSGNSNLDSAGHGDEDEDIDEVLDVGHSGEDQDTDIDTDTDMSEEGYLTASEEMRVVKLEDGEQLEQAEEGKEDEDEQEL